MICIRNNAIEAVGLLVTTCQCMVMRLSRLQDQGKLADEHASLAKAFCTVKIRETVGFAKELLRANEILLD